MPIAVTDRSGRVARAVGSEVPAEPFAFRVHSVFASALNLRVAGGRFLVTLLPAGAEEYPQGVELASAERFDAWPVRAGDTGVCDGERLTFDARPGVRAPAVTLLGAERRTRAKLPALALASVARGPLWDAAVADLAARQADAGAPLRVRAVLGEEPARGALAERFARGAAALAEALRHHEPREASRAATAFVGLGTGLTPSGDDFLCGVLAALDCGSIGDERARRALAALGAAVAARLEATNAVSATFLGCALAGAYAGALAGLANAFALAAPDAAATGRAMARLCEIGHTSGMDTASGFLFACANGADAQARGHAPSI